MFLSRHKIALLPALFFIAFAGIAWADNDARSTDSPYGVLDLFSWGHDWNGHHYTPEKIERAAKMMKEAGIGIVRMDFLWNDIQPQKDKWDFQKYDRIVDILSKNDIKILGLLDYNADWAGEKWNSAPDPKLFTIYARAVVARYKSKVRYWEVWNEPDQNFYWIPSDQMKAYSALLKEVYPAIKAEDPTSLVLMGGISGNAAMTLAQLYSHKTKNYFDIVNIHPFQDPLGPDPIAQMKKEYEAVLAVMEKNGDKSKPIWFTEIGCPGVPDSKTVPKWWNGENPDEQAQAQWVEKLYGEPLKWNGVEKIFWAFFRDTPNYFLTGTDYFGLVSEDFTPKPAYQSYRKMVSDRLVVKDKDQVSKGNS